MWTGYTTSSYFTVVDSITIPTYAIPNVLTGMRVILNNDTGPNPQSDSACGEYTSGETEDFVIVFRTPTSTPVWLNVNPLDNITNMMVYPNPTSGKFSVKIEAQRAIQEATLTVTNVTGQQLLQKRYAKPGRKLLEEMDLSNLARGVYFVELKADNEKHIKKLIVK